MFGFGPLSSLYYMGFFPCCQKEEDKNARDALKQINTIGTNIIWHRDNRKRLVDNVKAAAFSFLKKKNTGQNSGGGGGGDNNDNDSDNNNPLVKAQFKLYDNEDGIPEILVAKRDVNITTTSTTMEGMTYSDADDGIDGEFGGFGFADEEEEESTKKKQNKKKQDKNKNKNKNNQQQISILLKRIYTVVPIEQDLITLNILEPDGQQTKEWVRFTLDEIIQDNNITRNMFVHNLQVLMEWDKQRRNISGELEYDETSDAVTLRSRAQKAAHFARREIEMKQVKRSREERKAKYVQESGGLKYTALAMAKNAGATS